MPGVPHVARHWIGKEPVMVLLAVVDIESEGADMSFGFGPGGFAVSSLLFILVEQMGADSVQASSVTSIGDGWELLVGLALKQCGAETSKLTCIGNYSCELCIGSWLPLIKSGGRVVIR